MRQPIERLKEKVEKENLWLFILCILREREHYGYEIRGKIEKTFGFLSGNVTAYKVLYLLENNGYVTKKEKGNRSYYFITKNGLEQIKKAKLFIKKIDESI